MKPMPIAVKYFLDEIIKRASKSFAKAELSKEEFDSVVSSIENVRDIVNKAKKEGCENGRSENNKES